LNGKGGKVTVDGTDYELRKEMCMLENKKTKTSVVKFTPSVIEPFFGVDRLISGVCEHA
jgi:glycyl-tRNA synthetase (class II)